VQKTRALQLYMFKLVFVHIMFVIWTSFW